MAGTHRQFFGAPGVLIMCNIIAYFVSQTLLLVNIHQKAIKTLTSMNSQLHFITKSTSNSFSTKNSYFHPNFSSNTNNSNPNNIQTYI